MNSALVVSRGRLGEERKAVQSSSTSSSVVAHYGVEEIRSVSAEEQSQSWGEGREVSSNGGARAAPTASLSTPVIYLYECSYTRCSESETPIPQCGAVGVCRVQFSHRHISFFSSRNPAFFSFLNFFKLVSPGVPGFHFLIFVYLVHLSFSDSVDLTGQSSLLNISLFLEHFANQHQFSESECFLPITPILAPVLSEPNLCFLRSLA